MGGAAFGTALDDFVLGLARGPKVCFVPTASSESSEYVIRFYSNPSGEEGKKFIGQKIVFANLNGNASFTFSPSASVAVGQTITATATNVRGGGTSEFSAPKKVTSS